MISQLLNPLAYEPVTSKLLAGILLLLAGISLGLGIADVADNPLARAAFLDDGLIRGVVDGRWWMFGLVGLLVYAVREGVPLRHRLVPRPFTKRVPIEVAVVLILAGTTALALSYLSVEFFPCVLGNRC